LIDSISILRLKVTAQLKTCRKNLSCLDTLFINPGKPSSSRLTGHPDQLATLHPASFSTHPKMRFDLYRASCSEIPLTNLCNQLIVIGTRKIFRLSNVRLSP
jgi:hypothetical protein